MARLASGSVTSSGPNTRVGAQQGFGGGANTNPMNNQFQYTAAGYSPDVESSYKEQLSQNAKDAAAAQGTAENYANSLQRRNASNAAISGYSVGGGGFLAGQNVAAQQGVANAMDVSRTFADRATGIRQNQANYRAGIDQYNNGMQNQYGFENYSYNRGRTDTLADRKAEADSASFGNKVTNAVNAATASLGQYGITYADGKGSGVGWAEAAPLLDALRNATTPDELSKAQAALDGFMARRAQARNAYRNGEGDAGKHYYQDESTYLKSQGW